MVKLTHNSDFISLLYELSQIDNSFILKPDNNKITLIRHDEAPTMVFQLIAPLEYFGIPQDIAIHKFRDFYNFYKSQKNCDILLDTERGEIIFKTSNSELPYPLSDPEFIINDKIPSRFDVPEEDCDFVFTLNSDDVHSLASKMLQIKPDTGTNSKLICNISYKNKQAEIVLKAESYKPSFKLFIPVDKIYNTNYESQNYTILPNIFQCLPKNRNFIVFDLFEKVLIFKLIDPNVSLNIVTWKIYE